MSEHIKKNIYYLYLFNLGAILHIINLIIKMFTKTRDIEFWEIINIGLI